SQGSWLLVSVLVGQGPVAGLAMQPGVGVFVQSDAAPVVEKQPWLTTRVAVGHAGIPAVFGGQAGVGVWVGKSVAPSVGTAGALTRLSATSRRSAGRRSQVSRIVISLGRTAALRTARGAAARSDSHVINQSPRACVMTQITPGR